MNKTRAARAVLCLSMGAAAAAPQAVRAQDFSMELEGGGIYDSHLTTEEIDGEQEADDYGARVRGDFKLVALDTRPLKIDLQYTFDQTAYADFDEFDIQSHRVGGGLLTRVGAARLGLDYDFRHVRLGGNALYDQHSVTPHVAGLIGTRYYARAFYRYSDKAFDELTRRDADNQVLGAMVLRFFQERRGYLSASAQYETEDARDAALDHEGFQVGVDLKLPLAEGKHYPYAKLGYQYRDRDYDNLSPSIGERRTEERSRAGASLVLPLDARFRVETDYRYTDRQSNFASADYHEHRVGLSIVYEL